MPIMALRHAAFALHWWKGMGIRVGSDFGSEYSSEIAAAFKLLCPAQHDLLQMHSVQRP